MIRFWCLAGLAGLLLAALLPVTASPSGDAGAAAGAGLAPGGLPGLPLGWLGLAVALPAAWIGRDGRLPAWRLASLAGLLLLSCLLALDWVHGPLAGQAGGGYWAFILGLWALAWLTIDAIGLLRSGREVVQRGLDLLVPLLFGLWLLFLWEVTVTGFGVPQVLLPAPSLIAAKLAVSADILWADFRQTFLKAVLSGYALGCGSGLLVAVLVDRVPFLQRGLLPLGNFVSALPIVGVAPIMVMWFGFDWQSKTAVVVIMTFFPMLVNAVTGLHAAGRLERELIHTYAAGYWQTLFKLRFPVAMPFIFNALKINSTLALIGAIVAEFFGTPIVGMGFRISTEVGRMNIDMVWAEIVVAAIAGSAFYGLMTVLERRYTFWHPSFRQRRV